LRVLCRGVSDSGPLFDDILYRFLLTSLRSRRVLVVSPWLSPFELRSLKVVYYPFISSQRVNEVLSAAAGKGVRVVIAARCFDFLDYGLLVLALNTLRGGPRDSGVLEYLAASIDNLRDRVETLVNFCYRGKYECRLDVEQRLHSKVYVNDFMAIVGSANFTYSGFYRNLECLTVLPSDDAEYSYIVDYAENLVRSLKGVEECERHVVESLQSTLGLRVRGLGGLVELLNNLSARIRSLRT
jgi:phosphatidylserine/phosphatidylglycerophosphate/cardiolipin synthase-like enzyme